MRRYRFLPYAAPVILAAGLICASPGVALADNQPPSQVLSNYESSTGSDIARDCGFSTPLPADPGDSLWLFCDTAVYGFNAQDQWGLTSFITGSTAAEAPSTPGEVPTDLSEVSTPGGGPATLPNSNAPAHFLPIPSGLITTSGEPCDSADGAYAASWISGVTRDTANPSDVLVSFNDYCVMGNLDYLAEGYGLAEYDPEQTNDAGAFTVYQASRPAGAWTETTTGTVPCTIEGDDFCHALVAHPELSTSSDLLISYFNPAAAPFYQPSEPAEGHLMVASFPW